MLILHVHVCFCAHTCVCTFYMHMYTCIMYMYYTRACYNFIAYMYSTRQIKVYIAFYETIIKTMHIVYANANETVNQFQINAR